MPSRAVAVDMQLRTVSMCLEVTISTLDVIVDAFNTPYLQPISLTLRSLMKLMENIKHNRRKDLLALPSLLPDGLSDVDLLQSNIPIEDILRCKVALLRTSLAYTNQNRLKVLTPIREYMQAHYPPLLSHTEALFHNYSPVLELFFSSERGAGPNSMAISTNFANMQSIVQFRLQHVPTDLKPTLYAALHLNNFSKAIGQPEIPLMTHVSPDLIQPPDPELEVCWVSDRILTKPMEKHDLETLIAQTLVYFPHFRDSQVKSRFYRNVGRCYELKADPIAAMKWHREALRMAISTRDFLEQSIALERLAWSEQSLGGYATALAHASEAGKLTKIGGSFTAEVAALRVECISLTWLGRYSKSLAHYQRAQTLLSLSGVAGDFLSQIIASDLVQLLMFKSEYTQAQTIMMPVFGSWKNSANHFAKASLLVFLAQAALEAGASAQAVEKNIDEAMQGFTQSRAETGFISCDIVRAALNLREGNMLIAKDTLKRSFRSSLGNNSEASTYCLEKLGDIMLWRPPQATLTWPTILLAHALKSKYKLHIYKGLQFLGDFAFIEGDHDTANSLLVFALDAFTNMDIHCSRGECMLQLGNIAQIHGHYPRAKELWMSARSLFECSSQWNKVLLLDKNLAAADMKVQSESELAAFKVQAPIATIAVKEERSEEGKDVDDHAMSIVV